jgi:hypothetical protein
VWRWQNLTLLCAFLLRICLGMEWLVEQINTGKEEAKN